MRRITDSRLKKSVEHVQYEIDMFITSSVLLMNGVDNQFEQNSLLETFSIHLRNLYFFFYTKKQDRKQDDILAEDFLLESSEFYKKKVNKKAFMNVPRRTAKMIAHLTYHRIIYNKRTKPWQFAKTYEDMQVTIQAFIDCLPEVRKKLFRSPTAPFQWGPTIRK